MNVILDNHCNSWRLSKIGILLANYTHLMIVLLSRQGKNRLDFSWDLRTTLLILWFLVIFLCRFTDGSRPIDRYIHRFLYLEFSCEAWWKRDEPRLILDSLCRFKQTNEVNLIINLPFGDGVYHPSMELGTRLTGGREEFSTPAMLSICFSADLQWSEHSSPFWIFHAAVPLVKAASSRN